MTFTNETYKQAELAMAAYADLTAGIEDEGFVTALQQRGEGMSRRQATNFAENLGLKGQAQHSRAV